eukprot:scaffold220015_cov21-Tisochrysis_lutea.AAC.1
MNDIASATGDTHTRMHTHTHACTHTCTHKRTHVRYLRALNIAYGRKYGDTLVRCVQKQFSGYLGEGMQAMLVDHDK